MTPKTVCLALAACGLGLAAATHETGAETGDPRVPISEMWAVVGSDGVLARGRGAISSLTVGRGLYEVRFTSPVDDCVYQATLGSPDTSTPPVGMIAVAPRAGNAKAVRVRTNNVVGTPFVAGFHLYVSCDDGAEPRLSANDRWAFVESDGRILAHGQGGPAQGDWLGGPGYEVIFDKDVRQCAFLATPLWRNPLPTVGVARRARNPNGVLVRMSTFGSRFYLVLKCPMDGPKSAMPRTHPADRWAVVNSNGTLARGVGVEETRKVNTGSYSVRVETDVMSASMPVLATLGSASPRQGLPAAGLIYPKVNCWCQGGVSMQISTKDAGGAAANRPFHLYAVRHPRAVFP